jgi:PAS domain S-box-containing protein
MHQAALTPQIQVELIEIAHAAMIVRDYRGRVLFWNRGAEELYGWPRAEALGQVTHVLLKTLFPLPLSEIEVVVQATGRWEGELVHTTRDGRRLDVLSRWALDGTGAGEKGSILEVNLDVTQQKLAEQEAARLQSEAAARAEAEAAQRRFAFLAEASAILSSSLDYETTLASVARLTVPHIADWCTVDMLQDDGTLELLAVAHVDPEKVQWARELRRRYPLDPASPVGAPHVVRDGQPEMYPVITDEMLSAAAHNVEELAILRAVGYSSIMVVPIWARGRALGAITLVAAESGRHFGPLDLGLAQNLARHVGLAIDNARLYRQVQRLNESLERRADHLEAANRELEAFAYSVSHDLRSPLRAIDGFSRILLDEYTANLDEDGRHYLETVRNNAQQMGKLIDDLLAFSRLGRQQLEKQPVKLEEVARQALAELAGEQGGREVEVVVGELPPAQGDPQLLKQVFLNLLSNALKFTRNCANARVEVGSLMENGRPVYFVKDNGVGFDMQYAGKLFGVFQRLHRAEDYEGTGAGLAIVQRIVHRHGGRIWADAVEGEGATFYFTL